MWTLSRVSIVDTDPRNTFNMNVTFDVEFNVSHDDMHDFDDALRDWARHWREIFEERKAKQEKELTNDRFD